MTIMIPSSSSISEKAIAVRVPCLVIHVMVVRRSTAEARNKISTIHPCFNIKHDRQNVPPVFESRRQWKCELSRDPSPHSILCRLRIKASLNCADTMDEGLLSSMS